MLLSYACSFPHNNIHTYIMYIFRVSISMCKCSYDSIPLYSIHVKVYCYCLTLNCYCPISTCYCLTLNCYCLTFPTVTVWLFQLLLFDFSNRYCLTFPTVTVWLGTVTVWLFQPLLFDFELLLFTLWTVIDYTLNCYCPTVTI